MPEGFAMSIPIKCPECKASYRVADDVAGLSIKCRECGARVSVPSDDGYRESTSRSKRPRDDDDYDEAPRRKPKKKAGMSAGTILAIIGGVLAFTCLICGGGGAIAVYWGVGKAGEVIDDINMNMNAGMIPPGRGPVLLSQRGRLMPNDPFRENKPHKPFTVQLVKGKTYVIDLQSREMDSYLFLYDPNGIRVAEDDDSGGNLDSRIQFTPNQTGNYVVSASVLFAVGPAGANFTLTVREQ
jgi:predicted Zn finger-like uncharacterized protein